MHIHPQFLKDLKSNPRVLLEKMSIKEIAKLLKQANAAYHQEGKPLFSDDIYDLVKDYLTKLDPANPVLKQVGAPAKAKVKLPVLMGSLGKLKQPQELALWESKHLAPYVFSDKLDGISALYVTHPSPRLFSRGDGIYGQDISHLLPFLNLPMTQTELVVRGELVISKANFLQIADARANPRNTVAGLANAKHPDPEMAKLASFVAYELIVPAPKTQLEALKTLSKHAFQVVYHEPAKTLNSAELSSLLERRRQEGPYEIDGIVVTSSPGDSIAFKNIHTLDQAEVVVHQVIWNVSKNALLKPVVTFDPVHLEGAHIRRATAHNAKFIAEHKIGPGTRLVIIRSGSVIPYIYKVISGTEAQFPDPMDLPHKWNDAKVELVLKNPHAAQAYHLRQIENYIETLGIKGLGSKIVKRLYEQGIDTLKKLMNVTKIDLYKSTRSSALALKIYKQIQEIYNKSTCVEFMAASNIFGGGIGKSKFKLICDAFPSVITDQKIPNLNELLATKGIGEKVARQFLEHIEDFYDFIDDTNLPCRSSLVTVEPTPEGFFSVNGKVIVFTGFRSKPLEDFVERRGGRIASGVSQHTSLLVARDANETSIKIETAKQLDIPIFAYKVFVEEVGFTPDVVNQEDELSNFKDELEKEGLLEEEESSDDEDFKEDALPKRAECVRHALNWASMKRSHIFGKSTFDATDVKEAIAQASPKLLALVENIAKLDEEDRRMYKKNFKHVIFSDVTKRGFGAKIIASALDAFGYTHVYDGGFALNLKKSPKNFAILAGTQVYTKPITVKFKTALLAAYNDRTRNVHGEYIRFIVLDNAYKEGIDLFDVKYVHLFEPLLTYADETQAIGRATRMCGQKGLPFVPDKGWPLHVYKYDYELSLDSNVRTGQELILREVQQQNTRDLARDIETVCMEGAIDKQYTRQVHQGGDASKYMWKLGPVVNACGSVQGPSQIPEYSPSQAYVRHYFQPSCPHKGLLLWHSIGSGKTCTAIACASHSWEAEGYTILWITRGSLRSDVYKNMFQVSCMERVRDFLKSGHELPDHPKRLISRHWLPPLSYRQLNNCLKRSNRLYDYLVKKNGYSDPFRKTLIIIDEAHLMLSPSIKPKDRPDVGLLKGFLRNSHKTSGEHSARVLLMSATPITNDPFNFAPLMNLTSEKDTIPEDDQAFVRRYLNAQLRFTTKGKAQFKADIKGRLSYLNRMKDARQFAQPTVHIVHVPASEPPSFAHLEEEIAGIHTKVADVKKQIMETKYAKRIADCQKDKECIKREKDALDKETKSIIEQNKETIKKRKQEIKDAKKNSMSVMTTLQKCYKNLTLK